MRTRTRRGLSPVSAPGRWTRGVVGMAVRLLPAGQVRERYRREFVAEMYGMASVQRTTHALQILRSIFALRTALVGYQQPLLEEATMTKPLGCRLHLHHVWERRSTQDGSRYRQCARCGKDKYDGPTGSGDWAGGGSSFGG